jgi:hypothetical protein
MCPAVEAIGFEFNSHFDKNNGLKSSGPESNCPGIIMWFAGMVFVYMCWR